MKKMALCAAIVAALVSTSVAAAAGTPAVRFATPETGATTGSTVTFIVSLTHFRLDPKDVGKQKKPNLGHLHFQMDGGKYDYPKYSGANGKLAVTLGIAGKYSPAVLPTIMYRHLPAGKHKLVVFLANNDHSAVGPKATVTFTVK
jgi:opacity protein-like surface antigen